MQMTRYSRSRSWEMSTIGHPLSDLSNLLSPYTLAASSSPSRLSSGTDVSHFVPDALLEGIPTRAQLTEWYAEIAGWNPAVEGKWGDAFGAFRKSVIAQGIAARLALRQASSAQAQNHAVMMGPLGQHAWSLVELAKGGEDGISKAKL